MGKYVHYTKRVIYDIYISVHLTYFKAYPDMCERTVKELPWSVMLTIELTRVTP